MRLKTVGPQPLTEFAPPTCSSCGKGVGDLKVDYQDTTSDF